MQIRVEHLDQSGQTSNLQATMSLPAFLKHAALAGQGPATGLFPSFSRGLGLLLYYQGYLDVGASLSLTGLRRPQPSDPTELGDFSTIAGRAIGDFLAKSLLGATYTLTYEAVMQPVIAGPRPDFVCMTGTTEFAMECKGRAGASLTRATIADAKRQSLLGTVPVAYGYASLAFDLYNQPRTYLCDPERSDNGLDPARRHELISKYYEHLMEDLLRLIGLSRLTLRGRDYYHVSFPLDKLDVTLLLDAAIADGDDPNYSARSEVTNEHDLYLDRDGIGVAIRERD